MILDVPVPRWALPLLPPCRYKGAKGGRSGGKSHFFAEQLVSRWAGKPNLKTVGIREIQRTLDQSVKALIEAKILKLGVADLFDVQRQVIRHKRGDGIMVFWGMQDHNADSIKGLEDFDIALVDEANAISKRSLQLLTPTLRKQGSEIWFGWNPDQESDPVDVFFRENEGDADFNLVHVNIDENPHISDTGWREYTRARERAQANPNDWAIFEHIWHGAYHVLSEAIVFSGKWVLSEFEPELTWDGPYFGSDFGFSQDPSTFSEWWIHGENLYCRRDCGGVGIELDDLADFAVRNMPGIGKQAVRCDNSRPETISYLKRTGLPGAVAAPKWQGSVEDGVAWMRSFKRIVIHPDAPGLTKEAKLYRYKTNKAGDILPTIEDADNHYWDAGRYALAPLIQARGAPSIRTL